MNKLAAILYLLCAGTALGCSWLLLRKHRDTRMPLLWWSGLFFAGLAVDNVFLFIDRTMVPEVDMTLYRNPVALLSVSLLLYGMIWKAK